VAQQYPSLQLVEETIEKQLDNQISHIDSLDTKAGILFGFLAVTLGSAAGSKDFFEAAKTYNALKIAVGAIFIAFLLTLVAFAVREYRRDPNPRQLRQKYPSKSEETTRFALSDAYIDSFEANITKINRKVQAIRATLVLAGIGGLAFAVHLILGW
jgi:preprotein translocase subunit SecG